MTHTITVTGEYTVDAGESLSFVDEVGFVLDRGRKTIPDFLNLGDVTVTAASDSTGPAWGVYAYIGSVANGPGGSFSVANASSTYDAVGLYGDYGLEAFHNDGAWTVTSVTHATGAAMAYCLDFANTGELRVAGGEGALGVEMEFGKVDNQGLIEVRGGAGAAIGLLWGGSDQPLSNSGRIVAVDREGASDSVALQLSARDDAVYVINNSGLIRSTDFAIRELQVVSPYQTAVETVVNSGKIVGVVDLGLGDDTLSNSGAIRGDVLLGRGDDLYDGGLGRLHGDLYGGIGDDTLVGGRSGDTIHGDDGFDGGQDGDDRIEGGRGADSLFGDDGDDTLEGGKGTDTLSGGAGKDVFRFASADDTASDAPDVVVDLGKYDHIDLSGIDADTSQAGDQAFHLVGALSGHAGEVALSYDGAEDRITLVLDVDGDGMADATLIILGDTATTANFIF